MQAREEKPPLDALQFVFERHVNRPSRGMASLGWLRVDTLFEATGMDDDLSDRASRRLASTERLFEACSRPHCAMGLARRHGPANCRRC